MRVAVARDGAPPTPSPSPDPSTGPPAAQAGPPPNAHFGHAREFHVFDVGAAGPRLVEIREAGTHCTGTGGDRELLRRSVGAVADCVAVVAARIGPCARRELDAAGVLALEHAGPGLDGLRSLIEALERSPVLRARQDARRQAQQVRQAQRAQQARQEVRTR